MNSRYANKGFFLPQREPLRLPPCTSLGGVKQCVYVECTASAMHVYFLVDTSLYTLNCALHYNLENTFRAKLTFTDSTKTSTRTEKTENKTLKTIYDGPVTRFRKRSTSFTHAEMQTEPLSPLPFLRPYLTAQPNAMDDNFESFRPRRIH